MFGLLVLGMFFDEWVYEFFPVYFACEGVKDFCFLWVDVFIFGVGVCVNKGYEFRVFYDVINCVVVIE